MSSIIPHPSSPQTWQQELANAFTHPTQLLAYLGLPRNGWDQGAATAFPFRVPRVFAARMHREDPHDPLLLQVLPRHEENLHTPGFTTDPVGDRHARVAPGVLHKYHGRVLLVATGACAVQCRYCFRREYPYQEDQMTASRWQTAIAYLRSDQSIEEVILSGGDPLIWGNPRLKSRIHELATLAHLRRLRIHTRLPIVLPSRVDSDLVQVLTDTRLQCLMVVHCNHANEIDASVVSAVNQLRQKGIVVLNQSTLLSGVNDSIEALVDLQQKLFDAGILPYYLHLLDRARGTTHFEVEDERAQSLYEQMRRRLPGYLVPRLARDTAQMPYKIWP